MIEIGIEKNELRSGTVNTIAPRRAPDRSARLIPDNARLTSGKNISPSRHMTASNDESSNAISSPSTTLISTL